MVALLVFIIAPLEVVFGRKKKLFHVKGPFDVKGPFGDNVIKNPARHILAFSLRVHDLGEY